jgi:demethylmenaquinone methyltransferase/2-methoxy-6-polyprenyl-1,4-benzoquinol methylase
MTLHDAAGLGKEPAGEADRTRERLIGTYRKKARHYDVTSRLYPVPGYPQRAQRLQAVQALGLRVTANGWSNVSLVHADAVSFSFPAEASAILSTYALTQVPECAEVIAHGAAALRAGGRWAVLDLKVPGRTPGWLAQLGTVTVRPFAAIDEWIARRPWEVIRAAMQAELTDFAWTELLFGTAFLAAGAS